MVAAPAQAFAEYIWLAPGGQLKSRTEVLDAKPESPEQAPVVCVLEGNPEAGEQPVELVLRPRKVFRDPFRGGDHVLVLCDVFAPQQSLAGGPLKQVGQKKRLGAAALAAGAAARAPPAWGPRKLARPLMPSHPACCLLAACVPGLPLFEPPCAREPQQQNQQQSFFLASRRV